MLQVVGCKIYFTAVMYVFCTDLNRHNHYTQQLQTTSQAAISHNKKWKLSEEQMYINIDKVHTWLRQM